MRRILGRAFVVAFCLLTCPFVSVNAQTTPAAAPAAAPVGAPSLPQAVPALTLPGLKENEYVAICGDSITEQKQYSVFMEDYLLMCKPKTNVRAAQFGWGGETVGGFLHRMSNVLRFPVTVATTFYGMNDGGYAALTDEKAKAYRDGTKAIVDTFKKTGVHFIVVGSPGVVDSKTFRPADPDADKVYNKTLLQLGEIASDVAKEEGVAFADVHGLMMDVMTKAKAKYGEGYPLAGQKDGVHPDANGHLVMAYAFLKALGCDGKIATINVDLAGNKATATDGQKVISMKDGVVELESTRYPFCFYGDPKSPDATSGVIEFFPFNADLNRYQLVVTNPGAATKLKITWGTKSKEYAAADLAKGVNLAADFIENPFSEPFKKVEASIRAQQEFETLLIKQMLPTLAEWTKMMPETKESLDKVGQGGLEKAKTLNDASAAAVAPVKHSIKIEAVK